MIDRHQLLGHAAWQAMQHVSEPDAVGGLKLAGDRRKQICLAEQRMVARQPLRGPRQAMAVDVEQREFVESRRIGAVDEEAGANAGLEMAGREVVTVEP